MLQLTKIFHFEMTHAIHGYSGACKNIRNHSYELHITVSGRETSGEYIPPIIRNKRLICKMGP